MVFNLFSRLFSKKEDFVSKDEFSEFCKLSDMKYADLRAQILNSGHSFEEKTNEILQALTILDEDVSALKTRPTPKQQEMPGIDLQKRMALIEDKLSVLHKNQKDLFVFGKLAIQNHETGQILKTHIDRIESLLERIQETGQVNLIDENLTNKVNLTKLNQNMVNFENDSNRTTIETKLNQNLTKNGLVKFSKLSKPGLVKFSNESVMLAPQEQQNLFFMYNVQADRQSRATTIKDVVEGLYGVQDQSKTSYISRTMRKLEFFGFVCKMRTGKTTSVWLTKKAIDYCRSALIERFESK